MVELIVGPSVRPAATAEARARSEAMERGELEMGTACSSTCRDLGAAVNRPTDQPTCLSHSSPSPSHEKENTRSWKVGRTTVDDGVKDGRNGGNGGGREGRRNE